jgi:predicted ribosomally synthesized peptide with nif11-like leader
MSVENVRSFIAKARGDNALDAKLQAVRMGAGQTTIAEIIKIADQAGYKFTAEDYDEAVNDVLNEKYAAGALNDEELALVAGGMMCVSSDATKKCTCCSKGFSLRKSL